MPFPPCPICRSTNMALRGSYPHRDVTVDLFYCLDCESFSSPLAEPLKRGNALDWHLSIEERNLGYGRDLFAAIGIEAPQILDIGCGTGTMIRLARELGGDGVGFDLDATSVEHGRARGFDLRSELWSAETETPSPDLILCIMVLEHIHWPRPLLNELITAARKHDAALFVSVPFFNREWWRYLELPVEADGFHPLRFPADHVSHFSYKGFEMAARQLGATDLKPIKAGWDGYLIRA